MVDATQLTRRGALGLVAGGVVATVSESFGFTNAIATRGVSVQTVDDPNAYLGLEVFSPVRKNSREPLVDVTNNTDGAYAVTVTLNDCTQGTLYDAAGGSGCSVSFSLSTGATTTVDIEAAEAATIPFTVSTDSPVIEAVRETEAQAGNVKGAVNIKKVQNFAADASRDEWTIDKVHVKDGDGDDDLDWVAYEVRDGDGNVVATSGDSASGGKYQVKNVTIRPDDPNDDVVSGESYQLRVTASDVDGNSDTASRSDTA